MPSNIIQNGFCTENNCSFHHIAYTRHFTHHLLLTVIVHLSVIYREKINYFGKESIVKCIWRYFSLVQQAFYLQITLSLAINYSFYKVSNANTQHMVKFCKNLIFAYSAILLFHIQHFTNSWRSLLIDSAVWLCGGAYTQNDHVRLLPNRSVIYNELQASPRLHHTVRLFQ